MVVVIVAVGGDDESCHDEANPMVVIVLLWFCRFVTAANQRQQRSNTKKKKDDRTNQPTNERKHRLQRPVTFTWLVGVTLQKCSNMHASTIGRTDRPTQIRELLVSHCSEISTPSDITRTLPQQVDTPKPHNHIGFVEITRPTDPSQIW